MLSQSPGQEQWALEFLQGLVDMDTSRRRIFTVHIYARAQHDVEATARTVSRADPERPRLLRVDGPLDVTWFLNQEWAAEAGNMVLSGEQRKF